MILENKIIEYLEGQLSVEETKAFERKIENGDELREQVEEYREMFENIDHLPVHQPSKKLEQNFYSFLEKEQGGEALNVIPLWRRYRSAFGIAAGIALFVFGLWAGTFLNNKQAKQISKIESDLQATQNLMLNMLQKKSASQRIKAVNYSYDFETNDQKIIDALIQTMHFDPNMNVRLHAAEALARFGEEEKVRDAFLMALVGHDNPEMQIQAINILVGLKEERAVGEMLKMLERDSLIDPVKQSVQHGLETLL